MSSEQYAAAMQTSSASMLGVLLSASRSTCNRRFLQQSRSFQTEKSWYASEGILEAQVESSSCCAGLRYHWPLSSWSACPKEKATKGNASEGRAIGVGGERRE